MWNPFARRLYFRFNSDLLRVRCTASGREYRDSPVVALEAVGSSRRVLAVGEEARSVEREARSRGTRGVTVVNPLLHDRVIISDFEVADALFRFAQAQVSGRFAFALRPAVVLHPQYASLSGLAEMERRSLTDLASSIGARSVGIHEGRDLSDADVLSFELQSVIR